MQINSISSQAICSANETTGSPATLQSALVSHSSRQPLCTVRFGRGRPGRRRNRRRTVSSHPAIISAAAVLLTAPLRSPSSGGVIDPASPDGRCAMLDPAGGGTRAARPPGLVMAHPVYHRTGGKKHREKVQKLALDGRVKHGQKETV